LHPPFQVTEGAKTLGWTLRKYLTALKEAGLGSLPGTAAEVLDDETRAIICPDLLNTAQWLEVRKKPFTEVLSMGRSLLVAKPVQANVISRYRVSESVRE